MTFNLKGRFCCTNSRNTCVEVALERFANRRQATTHEFSRARKQGGNAPGRNKLERLFKNLSQINAKLNSLVANLILWANAYHNTLGLVVRIPVGGNNHRGNACRNRNTQALCAPYTFRNRSAMVRAHYDHIMAFGRTD